MVEHRPPVPRKFVDKILRPFKVPEETIIKEFLPTEELFKLLNTEGEPFNVLNNGFRMLLIKKGISYDLSGMHAPINRLGKPSRITRMAFLVEKQEKAAHFLVVETDSSFSDIGTGDHDPSKGDLHIFNIIKPIKKNSGPEINLRDLADLYTPYIVLIRKNFGVGKNLDKGYGIIPGIQHNQTLVNGEAVKGLLREWLEYRMY